MNARKTITSISIYVPLTVFAIITLIPFVYLLCSALKPMNVFFSSPFVPTVGLFQVDRGTGQLSMGDVTLLPDEPRVYELGVAIRSGRDVVQARMLRIGFGDVSESVDVMIPRDPQVNQPIGQIAAPSIVSDAGPITYFITEGNQHGFLGRAWGLLSLENFENLFLGKPNPEDPTQRNRTGVARAVLNSFFYASVSSVLATLGAAMGGYALAKFHFTGRWAIESIVLAALVIPGSLLMAPGYQLLYWFGMLDSYVGLILPGIAPAFGVYLFRQAMITSLPNEMMEAARIDGCSEIKMFFIMALPMVRPMAGAFLLITYLGAWNNFVGPQIILQTPEKYPLAVWISQLRGPYGSDYGLIMASTLVAIAPVLILFLMLQKEFIAGLTSGAVKG